MKDEPLKRARISRGMLIAGREDEPIPGDSQVVGGPPTELLLKRRYQWVRDVLRPLLEFSARKKHARFYDVTIVLRARLSSPIANSQNERTGNWGASPETPPSESHARRRLSISSGSGIGPTCLTEMSS